MKKRVQENSARAEKNQRQKKKESTYILRLYITGSTPRAKSAVIKVKKFCEEHLKDHYELDVIDIYQQPNHAREAQIVAAPTLIKKLPEPLRKLVGDFSNPSRVVVALGLPE
ncbi:MAG TPA: circadian clock KaiB family protein [Candidatus Acidoferrales bacterium]|nr:circadian clock KaiB family protein [Candidatus Acidoferrales bacterium]